MENSKKSRSRSRDRHSKKKHKKEKRHHHRDSSSSRSSSRSGSREKKREHKKRFSDIPEHIRNGKPRRDEKGGPRFRVNNIALGGLILESKRTNERMDKEEVSLADQKFKIFDHSGRSSTLLSAAINSEKDWASYDEYFMEYRNGEYVKVKKPFCCAFEGCKLRFCYSTELEEHLQRHKELEEEQADINKKRAESFVENLK